MRHTSLSKLRAAYVRVGLQPLSQHRDMGGDRRYTSEDCNKYAGPRPKRNACIRLQIDGLRVGKDYMLATFPELAMRL